MRSFHLLSHPAPPPRAQIFPCTPRTRPVHFRKRHNHAPYPHFQTLTLQKLLQNARSAHFTSIAAAPERLTPKTPKNKPTALTSKPSWRSQNAISSPQTLIFFNQTNPPPPLSRRC